MFNKGDIPPETLMFGYIDQINLSIRRVRASLKDQANTDSLEDTAMIQSQAGIFFQAHIRRALAFLDGGRHALDAGHGLVALTTIRCLYESAACIHDFTNHVIKLIDAGNIPDAVRLAHQRALAQRFGVKELNTEHFDYTAVNILKQIDALDKVVPNARRDYDQLSEFVHPNAHGSVYYFMQVGDGAVRFRTPDDRHSLMGLLLSAAWLFHVIYEDELRFTIKIAELMASELQRRVDEYEARKTTV
jgi:hypothetical protein